MRVSRAGQRIAERCLKLARAGELDRARRRWIGISA